jgi:hypothetical protein
MAKAVAAACVWSVCTTHLFERFRRSDGVAPMAIRLFEMPAQQALRSSSSSAINEASALTP